MRNRYSMLTAGAFAAVIIIQGAHMVEHVAQVIQKFLLGFEKAQGLLGSAFDFEWVHFLYNTSLEAALILILVWCRRATGHPASLALQAVVWLQGYHVIEHVVKMYQYYVLGVPSGTTKGILGFILPVIWVHFWLNLIVLILIVLARYGYGRMLRQQVSRAEVG